MPQFLTKNETMLPISFTTWGTTSAERVIHCNSTTLVQSNNIASYFQLKNNSNPSASQIGVYDLDLFLKYPSNASSLLQCAKSLTDNLSQFEKSKGRATHFLKIGNCRFFIIPSLFYQESCDAIDTS